MSGNGYRIQSMTFSNEWCEIVFLQERLESKDVVDLTSRLVDPIVFRDRISSILEEIEELIDAADVHRRNPVPPVYSPQPEPEELGSDQQLSLW